MLRNIAALLLLPLTIACSQPDTAQDTAGAVGDAPAPSAVASQDARAQRDRRGVILFLGTSLTAGYGLGPEVAFPALIQQKIDSAGLPFRVMNAGLSGETSAGGLRRLEWSLQQPIDVLVLELGANDGLRGLDVSALRANLDSILSRTRRTYPAAALVVLGMEAPPNLGTRYTAAFRESFAAVARKHGAALVPFLLHDVARVPSLNLSDGIHPNAEGHRRVAGTVWQVLGPLLLERSRLNGDG